MNLNKLLLLFFFSGAISQENDEKDLLNNLIADKKSFYLKREGSKASPTNFAFKQLFTLAQLNRGWTKPQLEEIKARLKNG